MARAKQQSATKSEGSSLPNVRRLAPLAAASDPCREFLEEIEPDRGRNDIVLESHLLSIFDDILVELKNGEKLRRHGLPLRSKVLLCGPPGCGKTLLAEVFARELRLPFYVVRLEMLISSYLGETAANIRKIFDFASRIPCVLFIDEFDALGRTRTDAQEHNEIRRVVNSLLTLIDRHTSRGMVIAATNLQGTLDDALWRRFDEVLELGMPGDEAILDLMRLKFKNFKVSFKLETHAKKMSGFSFADVERVCFEAIKRCLLDDRKSVTLKNFSLALKNEQRRRALRTHI